MCRRVRLTVRLGVDLDLGEPIVESVQTFGAHRCATEFEMLGTYYVSVGMQNSPLVGIEFSPPIIDREIADGKESSGGRGSYRRTG